MSYRASSYINDEDYGYRVKSLLILLAKVTAELNNLPSRISDLRTIIYHLEKTKENIFDIQNPESRALSQGISRQLDYGIQSAESQIKEIDQQYEKIKQQRDFILYQLNEHGVPWHDRSFLIGLTRKDEKLESDNQNNGKRSFVADSVKIATKVYHELSEIINPDKFKIKLIQSQVELIKDRPGFCAVVTFSSAYAHEMESAFKVISQKSKEGGPEDSLLENPFNLPYDFFTIGNTGNLRPTLKDLGSSPSSSIEFRKELVFLNLESYQNSSDLLSEYIDMISREGEIIDPLLSQKAEANCMEAYFEDHKSEVNLSRLMQALEREIEVSQSFQKIAGN